MRRKFKLTLYWRYNNFCLTHITNYKRTTGTVLHGNCVQALNNYIINNTAN